MRGRLVNAIPVIACLLIVIATGGMLYFTRSTDQKLVTYGEDMNLGQRPSGKQIEGFIRLYNPGPDLIRVIGLSEC
jgi:hypothetical protein